MGFLLLFHMQTSRLNSVMKKGVLRTQDYIKREAFLLLLPLDRSQACSIHCARPLTLCWRTDTGSLARQSAITFHFPSYLPFAVVDVLLIYITAQTLMMYDELSQLLPRFVASKNLNEQTRKKNVLFFSFLCLKKLLLMQLINCILHGT